MGIPSQLLSIINRESDREASAVLQVLIKEILERHGEAAQAILFYGSCLRSGNDRDGLVDLYLLVDNYYTAYTSRIQALLNKLLPPNVYYLELNDGGGTVRTKYAVMSLTDFQKGTSMQWFHSYIWGRFSQPAALLYTRNARIAKVVQESLSQAVVTFIRRVLPRLPSEFSARDLWRIGFGLSYRAELRAERADKLVRMFDTTSQYYEEITRTVLDAAAYPVEMVDIDGTGSMRYRVRVSERVRLLSRLTWGLRSLQGKVLSVLRLLKAITTFEGGVDYILWKIERHSGVSIDVTPRLRHHPFLAMWVLSWRLYRRGGFR